VGEDRERTAEASGTSGQRREASILGTGDRVPSVSEDSHPRTIICEGM
jgi:hypothetical protein